MNLVHFCSKLRGICCCLFLEDQSGLHDDDWGREGISSGVDNERLLLLGFEECQLLDDRQPEYGTSTCSTMASCKNGFSVFAEPSSRCKNHGSNSLSFRPPMSSNRFGKMRLANQKSMNRNDREVKFGIDEKDELVDGLVDGSSGKSKEDKRLDKILEETACSMIDISMNPIAHSLSRHEAQERSKWYAERLRRLSPSLIKPCLGTGRLLADVHNPFSLYYERNGADVISEEDVALMDWATQEILQGLDYIRVQNGHDFVVPFPSLALTIENLVIRRSESV